MAKPIPLQLSPRDPREELKSRLDRAPLEHAEALLAGYEVLQGLHDEGVLELLRGLLGSGGKVLETAAEVARAPESVRAIRNLVILGKTLGEIDPDLFDGFAMALPEAMRQATPTRATRTSPPPRRQPKRTSTFASAIVSSRLRPIGIGSTGLTWSS